MRRCGICMMAGMNAITFLMKNKVDLILLDYERDSGGIAASG